MFARTSPQPLAVGEAVQMITNPVSNERLKQSYAASLQTNQSTLSKIELCPVMYDHGEPIIQFTMEEVNNFTKEEGLHQAVVVKFSYGRPDLVTVRKMFSSHFDVHGQYNIGQLEFRHLLIRFDLYDDYVRFLSRSTGYLKSKGEEFLFRTFPCTFGFNPREETSMAVVWISLPGLPPNLFAKRSLMSIAAAVGKPLAVDKATQDRTRPSTARVKFIVDLLKKHPKKVTLQILDSVSGKTVELHQLIVFDNLPKYCVFCKHQGHDLTACRIRKQKTGIEEGIEEDLDNNQSRNNVNKIGKLKGDARDFLNNKRAEQRAKDLQERKDNTGDKSTEGEQHMSGVLNSQQTADLNVKVGQCSSVVQHGNVEKQNDLTRSYVVPAEIKQSSAVYNIKDTQSEQVIEMDGQISKGSKQQQEMSAATSVENVPITEDVCNTAGIMQTTAHLKMQCMADNDNMIPNLDNAGSMQTNVNQSSQSAQDGQCIGIEAQQHKAVNAVNGQSNMQHLGSVNAITGSNLNPTEFIEQQQTKQMVIHENAILLNQAVGNNLETMAKDHTAVALQQRENSSVAAISDSSKVTGIHPHSRDSSVNQNNEAATQITTSFPEDDIGQNTNSQDIICQPECSKQNSHIVEESTALISSSNSSGKGNGGTGGNLQVIKSFSPIPYTYVESKDHEEFSILTGEDNPLSPSNIRDMVIKSKLCDQRQFDDEESWEECSTDNSSADEEQEDDYDSPREDMESKGKSAIVNWNASMPAAAKPNRLLNHNAPSYIPKCETSALENKTSMPTCDQKQDLTPHTGQRQDEHEFSAMLISSEQRHLQNDTEGSHTYEEGEEEETLAQCRKIAATKGDVSPMHSKAIKKCRQRDRSWDCRVVEDANIRRPPMRIAKQKQITKRTKNKA